jgi:hypothetical protein
MNETTNYYRNRYKLNHDFVISIICTPISYGYADNLFECAIIAPYTGIDHDTVQGYLTFRQVADYIDQAERTYGKYTDQTQD